MYVGGGVYGSKGYFSVIDASTLQVKSTIEVPYYVQSTPLVAKAVDGKTYAYFTCNGAEGTWPNYTSGGGAWVYCLETNTATKLFDATGSMANWCTKSIVMGADGTLYWTNDSGTLFALANAASSSNGNDSDSTQTPEKPGTNSQQGNNNAYGLDDPTAWIQYDRSRAGDSLRRFTEKLIAFRKAHRVFHQAGELQSMDVSGCGCPDISFHGRHVWYPEFDGVSRQLGVLYAGAGVGDSYFYTAYNMYGEEKSFALPHLPKGMCWERVIDTSLPEAEMFPESPEQKALEAQKEMIVKGRTVVVLEGRLPGGKDDTV